MAAALPLAARLSQVLVAFTIEFDNEFEHRMLTGASRGPWLVSMAMWSNFMRFIEPAGTPLEGIEPLVRATNLGGMQRWRYVTVADGSVVPTPQGRRAQSEWRPLAAVVEARWRERAGAQVFDALREALEALVSRIKVESLPSLPVVTYANGMRTAAPSLRGLAPAIERGIAESGLELSSLLSKALLSLTLAYEEASAVSLPIGADVIRLLSADGTRVRDLPALSGVSKEAISAALGFLDRRGYVVIEPDPTASRTKMARPTSKGLKAQRLHRRSLDDIEDRWRAEFGTDLFDALRGSLEQLFHPRDHGPSPLSKGLEPYPQGWRARRPYLRQTAARIADPGAALPHHPMILHRGGFPDGS